MDKPCTAPSTSSSNPWRDIDLLLELRSLRYAYQLVPFVLVARGRYEHHGLSGLHKAISAQRRPRVVRTAHKRRYNVRPGTDIQLSVHPLEATTKTGGWRGRQSGRSYRILRHADIGPAAKEFQFGRHFQTVSIYP